MNPREAAPSVHPNLAITRCRRAAGGPEAPSRDPLLISRPPAADTLGTSSCLTRIALGFYGNLAAQPWALRSVAEVAPTGPDDPRTAPLFAISAPAIPGVEWAHPRAGQARSRQPLRPPAEEVSPAPGRPR